MKQTHSFSNVPPSGVTREGDRLDVTIDTDVCAVNVSKAEAAQASGPVIPQGASELGQLFVLSNGKTDEHGNLLAKDGSILTQPNTGETLKDEYPSAQALIDDATRINYTGTVKCDGSIVHRDGPAVVGYGSQPDGTVKRLAQSPAPLPAPITITLPAPPTSDADQTHTIAWPLKGQIRPQTTGMGTGTATFVVTVPSDVPIKADHTGQIAIAEVPGGAVLSREVRVCINGIEVASASGNNAPTFTYTVGNHGAEPQRTFNVDPGETITTTVRNGPNETTQSGDFFFDFSTPNRY